MQEINNALYDDLGDDWYEAYDNPVALLRAEGNSIRPWVLKHIEKHFPNKSNCSLLDVGCGGGMDSNALAKEGYAVSAIDLSKESLEIARKYDETKLINYQCADAMDLPFPDNSFDVVISMDFLEHVEDPDKVIFEVSRVLKPGGIFFYHTFNKNPFSGFVVIKLVEWFVKNTPKNMHIYRLFLKPKTVRKFCQSAGMITLDMTGVRPKLFNFDVLKGLFTGIVPKSFSFALTSSTLISYCGVAQKNKQ